MSCDPASELSASELDDLAQALFWSNEPWRSVEVRRAAHQRWLDEGDTERAARSAWYVFYEHWLVGEAAVAQGWLARARRLVGEPDSPVAGWVALAEADVAAAAGRSEEALDHARTASRIGRTGADRDLLAMGLQSEGRALIALGRLGDGLLCLDEAMVAVIGNELQPMYVGWIYCNVIATCHAVGDLRRANEWSEAALRWCAELRDGRLYPGLCRVYAAQLAQLRGDWSGAERDARQACDDLLAYDARYAGAAHYVVADLCRLQGRTDEADRLYRRCHELGHDPQPGLALLRADTGRLGEALGALRPTVRDPSTGAPAGGPVVPRLQRLLAVAEVADRAGEVETLVAAAEEATAIAEGSSSEFAAAYALLARGRAALVLGDPGTGLVLLREAVAVLLDLGLPYESAGGRLLIARAAAQVGDELTATIETSLAEATLRRLGAFTSTRPSQPATPPVSPLSDRETEVLTVVAEGLTNREVASRLHLSEHTVARHLSNIFTKLDVRTRTAAVSVAAHRGFLGTGQD